MREPMTDKVSVTQAIKPCPFCGGSARSHLYVRDGGKVQCTNPECYGSVTAYEPDSNSKAIRAWNTRTASEQSRVGEGLASHADGSGDTQGALSSTDDSQSNTASQPASAEDNKVVDTQGFRERAAQLLLTISTRDIGLLAERVRRGLADDHPFLAALRTTHSPSEAEVEAAGIFPRIVTHERALDAARNFIDAHFNNSGGKGVLTCVPAREDDDDVVLVDYIKQRRALSLPGKTVELLREAREFVSIRGATTEAEQKKLLAKIDSHLGEMK